MPKKSVKELAIDYVHFIEKIEYEIVDHNFVLNAYIDIANGLVRELVENVIATIYDNPDINDSEFYEGCELIKNLLEYNLIE